MKHTTPEQSVDYDFALRYNSLMGPCPFGVGSSIPSPVTDHEGWTHTFSGLGFVEAIEESQCSGSEKKTVVYVKTHPLVR